MLELILKIVGMLILILIAAETFTNALEHLGEKLGISEGVTGSLFAAVGTALPETSIPLLVLLTGASNSQLNHDIGIGAILGAPLMLSTLSVFCMAISVLKKRGFHGCIKPEKTGFLRDINFFLAAFLLVGAALFVPPSLYYVKVIISVSLVLLYALYIFLTVKSSSHLATQGHETQAHSPLYLQKIKLPLNMFTIILQITLGLFLLVLGAKGFVHGIEGASHLFGISALLLSLLIIPIATELPEKINSVLWLRKGKDTLGVGNITGALVFQGTLLPALGIMMTPWQPTPAVFIGIVISFLACLWLRICTRENGIKVGFLFLNGLLYIAYIFLVLR